MKRRGWAGKGSGGKGCRSAEHGLACTKDRSAAVALGAALKSAVQLWRGDEVNRHAEMAMPMKSRVSLSLAKAGLMMDRNAQRNTMVSKVQHARQNALVDVEALTRPHLAPQVDELGDSSSISSLFRAK
jgi:hypothetical protein